jgi:hypothetical protein
LREFLFGEDSTEITSVIKEGFSRLKRLDLCRCWVDVRMFIENTPIPNLMSFRHDSDHNDRYFEIVNVVAVCFGRTLNNLDLSGCVISTAILAKIAERCTFLKKLAIPRFNDGEKGDLNLVDMKIIASIPRLQYLNIGTNRGRNVR